MDQSPPLSVPAWWIEDLDKGEAAIEAGRVVSGEEVMRDLYDALARLEAKLAAKDQREASAPR